MTNWKTSGAGPFLSRRPPARRRGQTTCDEVFDADRCSHSWQRKSPFPAFHRRCILLETGQLKKISESADNDSNPYNTSCRRGGFSRVFEPWASDEKRGWRWRKTSWPGTRWGHSSIERSARSRTASRSQQFPVRIKLLRSKEMICSGFVSSSLVQAFIYAATLLL